MAPLMGTLFKWALMLTLLAGGITVLVVIVGIGTEYMFSPYNNNVLQDIFSIIQLWLPFNLDVVINWVVVASTIYLGFRTTMFVYNHTSKAMQQ